VLLLLLKNSAMWSISKSWSTKVLHRFTTTITPEPRYANIYYDSNSYFANSMNSHVGVANSRYVASANTYVDNGPHPIYHNSYVQEPIDVNYEFVEF
jgi:hypothetical protein